MSSDDAALVAQRVTDKINATSPLDVTASWTPTSELVHLTGATVVTPLSSAIDLIVTVAQNEILEFDGSTVGVATATVFREGDTSQPLTVNLAVDDTNVATVPASVTIPPGQQSVSFPVTAVNNSVAEGLRTVIVTATAAGFRSVTDTLDVEDDDVPALTIAFQFADEYQTIDLGDVTTGDLVLTFDSASTGDLDLSVVDGAAIQAELRTLSTINGPHVSVTGPVGGPFTVRFENNLGAQDVVALVATEGTTSLDGSGIGAITITEPAGAPPTPTTSVGEDFGFAAVEAVITRNTPIDEDAVITVISRDASELLIGDAPGSGDVTEVEPNNTFSTSQNIDLEDWTLADNPNIGDLTGPTSTLIPHVTISGTGDSTFDYYSFTATANSVGIFDIDGASFNTELFVFDPTGTPLTGGSNDNSATSSGAAGSTSTQDSYVEVTLPSDGLYTVAVGAFNSFSSVGAVNGTAPPVGGTYTLNVSVEGHPLNLPVDEDVFTIPAGSASVTIPLTPQLDYLDDGDQVAPLSAFGANFPHATNNITVIDNNQIPALTLTISADDFVESDGAGATTAVVTRIAPTTSDLTVNLLSHDEGEAIVQATIDIFAGETMSAPFDIDAIDDLVTDGTQTVTLVAYAAGHTRGEDTVDVTDDVTPTDPFAPGAIVWTPQGPGPMTGGQSENVARSPGGTVFNEVSGAMNVVAPHPTDPNIIFAGGTNAGVWRTTNARGPFLATPEAIVWEPLTDNQSSLSIGALEFDPTDGTNMTLVAANGRYSSYGREGGSRDGILRTTDGGDTWTRLNGGGTLTGANIAAVAPRGNVIVAAVNDADSFTAANLGTFRSIDGGLTFSKPATLPAAGVSYDIGADPTDPDILYTNIVFAETFPGGNVADNGIYKSIDAGASWSKVSDAARLMR